MRRSGFILAPLAVVAAALPLYAHKPIEVHWDQLCQRTAHHEIGIKTVTGETVYGYCVQVDANAVMTNDDDDRRFSVNRSEVTRILMFPKRHYLRDWAEAVGEWLYLGFHDGFSGLIVIPPTLVVGAVTAPYCAVVDLRAVLIGATEIRPK
jgi:hypothetical protein